MLRQKLARVVASLALAVTVAGAVVPTFPAFEAQAEDNEWIFLNQGGTVVEKTSITEEDATSSIIIRGKGDSEKIQVSGKTIHFENIELSELTLISSDYTYFFSGENKIEKLTIEAVATIALAKNASVEIGSLSDPNGYLCLSGGAFAGRDPLTDGATNVNIINPDASDSVLVKTDVEYNIFDLCVENDRSGSVSDGATITASNTVYGATAVTIEQYWGTDFIKTIERDGSSNNARSWDLDFTGDYEKVEIVGVQISCAAIVENNEVSGSVVLPSDYLLSDVILLDRSLYLLDDEGHGATNENCNVYLDGNTLYFNTTNPTANATRIIVAVLYGKAGELYYRASTLASDAVTAVGNDGLTFTVNTLPAGAAVDTLDDFVGDNESRRIVTVYTADVVPSVTVSGDVKVRIKLSPADAGRTAIVGHYKDGKWGERQELMIDDEGYVEPTFSGFSPIAVVVLGTGRRVTSSSSSSSSSGGGSGVHIHHYQWVLAQDATPYEDGLYVYMCECGHISDEQNFSYMQNIFEQLSSSILSAKAGETVTVNTYGYYTINQAFAEKFAATGVKLVIKFVYERENYVLTIPAGFDLTQTINEDGYAGYFYIGSFSGVMLEKQQ